MALTVTPKRPAGLSVVMTLTPVAHLPMAAMKSAGANGLGAVGAVRATAGAFIARIQCVAM